MARLTTAGNLAIFEHEKSMHSLHFDFDKEGILFIQGTPVNMGGNPIRTMKRHETGLKGYTAIGTYDYAKTVIQGDFEAVIVKAELIKENCILFMKTDTIEPA